MVFELYPIFSIFLILSLVGLAILAKNLKEKNQMRMREMVHRERMKAMEKELPVPESAVEDAISPAWASSAGGTAAKSVLWVRLSALCVGLFMLFTGIGMWIAFSVAPEPDLNDIATIGIMPALGGLGLILFYGLSGGLQTSVEDLERD